MECKITFIFPFIWISLPVLPGVLWGLWPQVWLFDSVPPPPLIFWDFCLCPPPSTFSSCSTESTHKYRYFPCTPQCTQMLQFCCANTASFLHFLTPAASELSCSVKCGSFFHESFLQLKAEFWWLIRKWLFDELIPFFKRKFTFLFPLWEWNHTFGRDSIWPWRYLFSYQGFGFPFPRKKVAAFNRVLPNASFHPPFMLILISVTPDPRVALWQALAGLSHSHWEAFGIILPPAVTPKHSPRRSLSLGNSHLLLS